MKFSFKKMLFIGLLFMIGLFGIYQYYQASLQPPERTEVAIIDIPQGSSSNEIADLLKEKKVIKNKESFFVYVLQSGKGKQLQAGRYQFEASDSVAQIVNKLASGLVYDDSIEVVIPEGLTVRQIARLLAEKKLVDEEVFVDEVNTGEFSYPFIDQIPASLPYRLEGYLFPKTYQFSTDLSEHDIIDSMLTQFQEEYDPEWIVELNERNMTLHDSLTLASIIEREVSVDKEQPLVAAVYFNRMDEGIRLQADATVQYALGKQKERLTFKDLKIEHPYNTYRNAGLPPGPIAAPGRSAIEAVIKPGNHNFLFYVTKKDGSGEHLFSRTFQEHKKNIAYSRKKEK